MVLCAFLRVLCQPSQAYKASKASKGGQVWAGGGQGVHSGNPTFLDVGCPFGALFLYVEEFGFWRAFSVNPNFLDVGCPFGAFLCQFEEFGFWRAVSV